MRYDYRCEDCGDMTLSHSIKEDRNGRECPECGKELKPLISGGAGILLTGRPAWAYNDSLRAAQIQEQEGGDAINKGTTVSDKRDGSKFQGKKVKIDRSIGNYNSQW